MSDPARQAFFWTFLAVMLLAAIPMAWLWAHHREPHQPAEPTRHARPPTPATHSAQSPAGWKVFVEVVQLGLQDGPQLSYRTITGQLPTRQPPDVLALQLAWPDRPPDGAVCHSTSWRFEDADTLVLTYAATPDTTRNDCYQLGEPAIVSSGDALRPAPAQLHAHHVAAHAVRHLAYLARHDPALAEPQRLRRELWAALQDVAQRTPTATHDCAHELARQLLPDPDQT